MLKLGNNNISKLFLGSQAISKAYLGNDLVWQAVKPLPYDAEVEYLESTGTQWIDTGYAVTTQNVRIVSRYCFTTPSSSSTVWGANLPTDRNWMANQYGGKWWFGTTSGQFGGSQPVVATDVEWTINDGIVSGTVGATSYSGTYSGSVVSGYSIYLFAVNNGGQADRYNTSFCKLFKFQLYENGVLVRDFIPVRVGGVGYMYDRVSKRLFGNQGTGNFIVGPDVVEVEYIESQPTGGQYIDTDYLFKSDNVEVTASLYSTQSSGQVLFGSE